NFGVQWSHRVLSPVAIKLIITRIRAGKSDRDHNPRAKRPRSPSFPSLFNGYGDLRPEVSGGVGGREWESNPPETGSLPHTDLKSGRPTGDDSPPRSSPDWHAAPNKSRRCGLILRSSPLRKVTPCRSKKSRIWI